MLESLNLMPFFILGYNSDLVTAKAIAALLSIQ